MVCTVCDPKLQLYPRDIYNAIVGGLQGCISTKTCIHPNLNQSVCEKLLHWRGEQKSFDKKKKSYSNIEVPVTFSGTKPFLNNDYKKSCKPSPLSGSAFYQNILNWKGYETRKTPLLCFCQLFWTWPCTMFNSVPIILNLLTNRNIALIYSDTIYE